MKKFLIVLIVLSLLMILSIPAMAHSRIPEQSIGRISFNAAPGMLAAYHEKGELDEKGGIAAHVFKKIFLPSFPHPAP